MPPRFDPCGGIAPREPQTCGDDGGDLRGPDRHDINGSMPHSHDLRTVFLSLAVISLAGCGKKGLEGPEAEVKKTDVKVDVPPIPDFTLPAASGDGSHSVKELRVKGKKLLETDITVKGVITWAYDCATAIRKPDQSDKDVADMIEKDPTKCERAKFYIGDTAETPVEKSLWVVDVPRPFNKAELKNLTKEELKNPAADRCDQRDPKKAMCPVYKVGDTVTITGSFKQSSPHSERNSDGLLVYKTLKNETQTWESPPPNPEAPVPGGAPGAAGAPAKGSPEDIVRNKKS
jgi:predicted small lipoprotein YifL